ncbi:class I SAM-dependent methyltransferase [Pseudomonas fluorescens]|uniref:Methyltransferase type 11 domain-containing protein n=1 Tax=Pseudomonas fluorescens TaxID=294 RepID=A0A5E7UXU0_PSEFL|nr:class I SAM-dependent methyltransferase [Pseudomonas fluorescens]VVQ16111.1 hypothetical protein PS941_04346 [Pseudomonas fluorescens]
MVSNSTGSGYDYAGQYNDFWSRSDRMGTDSYLDRNELVDSIIESVGYGKVLDLGCGEGRLVRALTERGLDAYGLDISQVAINRANSYMPGRFFCGSALELPFDDQEFDTVVSTDCLEHIHPDDVPRAIAEIRRVCKKHAYLQIATTQDRDGHWHLTVEGRDWWESSFFKNGFVRNPTYYKINSLADLSSSHWQITILMDVNPSWPNGDLTAGAFTSVAAESHAYLAVYKELTEFIKPGDVVFNWSDGSGEGGAVIRSLSNAGSVSLFVAEESESQAWKASSNRNSSLKLFSCADFQAECLNAVGRVNVVIIDSTKPSVLQCDDSYRALVPGGRLIRLHAVSDLAEAFEFAPPQSDYVFEKSGELSLLGVTYKYSVYMASIDQPHKSFVSSVHGYNAPPLNLINFERDYVNPWFPLGAVVNGVRTSNFELIGSMCSRVLAEESKVNTADFGASLCVMGYRLLERQEVSHDELKRYISMIDVFCTAQVDIQNAHLFRWLVSLSYLKAKLLLKAGALDEAAAELLNLVKHDVRRFSPTLGTKIVSAYIDLGNIRCALHDYESAVDSWTRGMHTGIEFLQADEVEWIGDPDLPIKGALYEATQIADLINTCTLSLRALKLYLAGVLPFNRIWEDASDSVFKINKKRFNLLEKQGARLASVEDAYFAQADLLEKRWDVMQSMEGMIQQRDEAIAHQGKMLEERWEAMQSMEAMIEERWAVMQSMEAMIEERDQIIAQHQTIDFVSHKGGVAECKVENQRFLEEVLASVANQVPFVDLALTNYVFTAKLYEAMQASDVRDLFFFAREGQSLKQMFDFYQASKKPKMPIRTHYLQVSRRSTLLLSLGKLEEESFDTLFRQYRQLSISEFLKSLVLEEHGPHLEQVLGVAPGAFDTVEHDLPTASVFTDLLQLQEFKHLYEAERASRSEAFLAYIDSMVVGGVPSELHVVDVGWKGSIQDNVFNWLKRLRGDAAVIKGYYLGLVAPGNLNSNNQKNGLVFSNINSLSDGFHVFNENRSLFEVVLHADHGSAQKYIKESNKEVVVVQDEFLEKQMIEDKILTVSREMMRLFEKVVNVMAVTPIAEDQLLRLAIKRHARMVFEPTESEVQWLLGLSHRENFGVFAESRFIVSTTKPTLKDRVEFTVNLLLRRRPSELGFWPWLAIKAKGVIGLSTVYKLFRLWKSR